MGLGNQAQAASQSSIKVVEDGDQLYHFLPFCNMNTKLFLALFVAGFVAYSTVSACGAAPKKTAAGAAATTAAPTTKAARRKRSIEDDVIILLETNLAYDPIRNNEYLHAVGDKLKAFAKEQNIQKSNNGPVAKSSVNVNGHFAAQLLIPSSANQCDEIKDIISQALTTMQEVSEATITCGFDAPVAIGKI